MWPFDSANTDSDWASRSRSSVVSRICQGSTGKQLSVIIGAQLLQVGHDTVGSVLAQGRRLADPVDAYDEAEASRPPGLDAGERVLEDGGLARLDRQQLGRMQEGVRRGLARQVPLADRDAVHALLHVIGE